jgi:ferredoxin
MAMSENQPRRVIVNPILCTGYGYCAEFVPELITLDDWGYPIVNSRPIVEEKLLHLARRAVATCPRLAVLLADADPNQ